MIDRLEQRQLIIGTAITYIGSQCMRYVSGRPELGRSPTTGFDCSGFASFVLEQAGITIGDYLTITGEQRPIRHTNEFFDYFGVSTHADNKQAGDLIFFSSHGWGPTHMGIVVNDKHYVHAPGSNGKEVAIEPIIQGAISVDMTAGHRILYNHNPIGYKSPTVVHHEPSSRVHQEAL